MKKFLFLVIAAATIFALLTTGCYGVNYITGSGPMVNQSYDFNDFSEIEISNAFVYDIARADNFSININCHENLVDHLNISKSANRLYIRMKNGTCTNSDIVATITLPVLNKLMVSGASKGHVTGFISGQPVDISVSGASQLDMSIEAGTTNMNVSGASKISGNLKTAAAHIEATGASHVSFQGSATADCTQHVSRASTLDIVDFKMMNADISVTGASYATIYAVGDLRIEATGASSVKYSGNPNIKTLNVSGASKVSSN
jgi:hypothetical protein